MSLVTRPNLKTANQLVLDHHKDLDGGQYSGFGRRLRHWLRSLLR